MRPLATAAVALLLGVSTAAAQEQGVRFRPEFRPFAGVLIPTGDFRNDFKTAETFGAQLAFEFSREVHAVASLGWTHGHNKLAVAQVDRTNVWQYDAGLEFNPFGHPGENWELRPFFGIGMGARTNDYQDTALKTTTCLAGYGALGTELQRGMFAFRIEGRDYLSCQENPISGIKKTRNDIRLNFGFALHLR